MTVTDSPRWTRASTRCEPINPAPPVTTAFENPPPFCAFTFKILSSLLLKLWFQDSLLKRASCSVPGGVVGWIFPDEDLQSGKRSPVCRSVF
ncbi:MAG: hypothetical protein BWY93_02067 [Euryarchaeota archaeon ADurb.BinA087]|nr:MAG: hypothetical protein BWY93_02067 [Euryarchaeota archaeon ADurb.BinA087]